MKIVVPLDQSPKGTTVFQYQAARIVLPMMENPTLNWIRTGDLTRIVRHLAGSHTAIERDTG